MGIPTNLVHLLHAWLDREGEPPEPDLARRLDRFTRRLARRHFGCD